VPSTISMRDRFGSPFLADGDLAIRFCAQEVEPILGRGEDVVFDFDGIDNMTDSFSNACFANLFARHRDMVGKQIRFKSCSPLVKEFMLSALAMADRTRRA